MDSWSTPILRTLDQGRIDQLREDDEFFWTDISLVDADAEAVSRAFKLADGAPRALLDFAPTGPPTRRLHVEKDLIVFAFWCAATPEPGPRGGADALGLFRVNVCLHGDFLLTAHERRIDLPRLIAEGGIPPGRSERYTVFVALEGMTSTMIEALGSVEREIAAIESELMDSESTERVDPDLIRSLRSRLTTLRMRIAAERGLFGRVGEEIAQIPSLEPDREAYFDRITASSTARSIASTPPQRHCRTCSTSSSTRRPSDSR